LVEQRFRKPQVARSIRVAGSSFSTYLPMRGGFTPPTTDPFVSEGKRVLGAHCPGCCLALKP